MKTIRFHIYITIATFTSVNPSTASFTILMYVMKFYECSLVSPFLVYITLLEKAKPSYIHKISLHTFVPTPPQCSVDPKQLFASVHLLRMYLRSGYFLVFIQFWKKIPPSLFIKASSSFIYMYAISACYKTRKPKPL